MKANYPIMLTKGSHNKLFFDEPEWLSFISGTDTEYTNYYKLVVKAIAQTYHYP